MGSSYPSKAIVERWQLLVHVCRRWRTLVFGSPRRLHLRLCCTAETPVRAALHIWPPLPLIVEGIVTTSGMSNIIAALGKSHRVRRVHLQLEDRQLEQVLAAMQVSFPELTDLQLASRFTTLRPIPDSFLDGSAPRLQSFRLDGIPSPFPGLIKLLSSATRLVCLALNHMPQSGCIPPEAMVALVTTLPNLGTLSLGFYYPPFYAGRQRQSLTPPTRAILPALETLNFNGVTEYLEDLVTIIDTPQLCKIYITFLEQFKYDCPRLAQFVNRTPKLRAPDKAYMRFDQGTKASVILRYTSLNDLRIDISCTHPSWRLSSVEQICSSSLLQPHSTVTNLYIEREHWNSELIWEVDEEEDAPWFQLLLPFTAVINLYICAEFAPGIADTLRELVEGEQTEVLPSLRSIFVEPLELSRPFEESIGQFAAVRRSSGHPIDISDWDKDSYMMSR